MLEAAEAFGSSPWQKLVKVQLPLALPTIMAGINQTIMMALAMVVVASMIGVQGLGQPVLKAIANQYFTLGLFNGLAIVAIAIIFDRISQAFGRRLQNFGGDANERSRNPDQPSLQALRRRAAEARGAGGSRHEPGRNARHAQPYPGAEGHQSRHRIRAHPGHHGPLRLRQVDPHPPYQPADRPDLRADPRGGQDVTRLSVKELRQFRRDATAMVFQKFALLPHRNVLDNTVYGLEIKGLARAEQEKQARKWIDRVGLGGYEQRLPSQLSGGMQQRVGLARALSNDAPILLMDEAFSALDPLIRVDMQSVLLDLQKEIRKTIVFITHDLDEALRLGDRIAILKDGLIVQNGTPEEIVLNPADDYVKAFVKEVSRGRVVTLGSVMRAGETTQSTLGLAATLTLDAALARMLAADAAEAAVLAEDGRIIGRARLTDIVSATIRGEENAA